MENIDSYLEIAGMLFTIVAAIAALTPTKRDDSVVERVRNLALLIRRKK